MAEKKKLRKYKMAVGICGPTVLYTNIIKAYSPEEAARKYLEEEAEGEFSEEKVQEYAREMFEIEDEKPVGSHLDARGEVLEPGDAVYAIIKADGRNPAITDGVVTKLTKRGVKVQINKAEYLISVSAKDTVSRFNDPFFSKLVKVTEKMEALGAPEVGSQVAYMEDAFMSSSKVFAFGTVTKITTGYIYISSDGKEARRTPDRIRRIQ